MRFAIMLVLSLATIVALLAVNELYHWAVTGLLYWPAILLYVFTSLVGYFTAWLMIGLKAEYDKNKQEVDGFLDDIN